MTKQYLRTYKPFDVEEVKKGLLIVGDLTGNCAACNELGINMFETATCPSCGTTFRYVASRRLESHPGERFKFAKRVAEKRPDLQLIDYSDYQKILGHKKAHDFFG